MAAQEPGEFAYEWLALWTELADCLAALDSYLTLDRPVVTVTRLAHFDGIDWYEVGLWVDMVGMVVKRFKKAEKCCGAYGW